MRLRSLELKDAEYMLEWMQDDSVVQHLDKKFRDCELEDCENFILNSLEDKKNIHFAIVDDADEYMGTVSLKNIDSKLKAAEFAITIRKCAMGKGYAKKAIKEILEIGKTEYSLKYIYWYVYKLNYRAIKFYDKNNFHRVNRKDIDIDYLEDKDYVWYLEKYEE